MGWQLLNFWPFKRRKPATVQAGVFKWRWPREIVSGPLDIRLEDGMNQIVFKWQVQCWFRDNGLEYGKDYQSKFRQLGNGNAAVDVWFRDSAWAVMYKLAWGGK